LGAEASLRTEGQWTIFALGTTRCVAVNRPVEEFNGSPFNALEFSRKPGEAGTELQVFFWPGAFTSGDTTTLTVTYDNSKSQSFKGTATDEYVMQADAPLSDADVMAIGASKLTQITADGIATSAVFFLTDKLPVVAARLTDCVSTLPPG
jgi:hypothetical protein